jgi:ubiquitin thioesterase protein OTUB1
MIHPLTRSSGHYDILYKAGDFPAPVHHAQPMQSQPTLHVAIAAGYNDGFMPVASNVNMMAMIPGMYSTGLGQSWPSISYPFESPTPQPQITPIEPYAPAPSSAGSVSSSHQDYMSPMHPSHATHHTSPNHHSIQLEQPPVTLPIHPAPQPPVSIERAPPVMERGGPFRPSIYELEPGFGSGQVHALPFQTSIFRK